MYLSMLSTIQPGQKPFSCTQPAPVRSWKKSSETWARTEVTSLGDQLGGRAGTFSAGRFSAWAMTSIESTPAMRPSASTTGRVARLALSRSPSASRRMSSRSSTGVERACRRSAGHRRHPGRSRSRSQRLRATRVVDEHREVLDVGVLHRGAQLARRSSPALAVATFHRSTSRTRCSARRLSDAVGADELLDELVGRVGEQLGGRRVLGEVPALLEDRDLVAHLDRLVDVVGDEDDRLGDLGLQAQELVLQPLAVDRVDRAEGLVHEQDGRVDRERAGDADALALAAGELGGVAVADLVGVERDRARAARRRGRGCASLSQPSSLRDGRDVLARPCGAGRGRSAGSRSRSRAAARPARGP